MSDTRLRRGLAYVARAVYVYELQIGLASLSFPSNQVVNRLDIFHGCAQPACIVQAGDSHFHWYADRQARRAGGRSQQEADLVASFYQLASKGPADEAGPA